MSSIRILIVSSIRLYREGLAQVLGRVEGIDVVGVVPGRREAVDGIRGQAPDIVLLDMATPESHRTARDVRDMTPDIPVVALGVAELEGDVLACAEAGVAGYLTREGSLEDLVATVENAARGELLCSPRIARGLFRRLATLAADHEPDLLQARLTSRERQIAHLIEQDLSISNKEIAGRLGIEVATVKNHVHNLLEKLNVHRRIEAARLVGHSPSSHTTAR